MTPTNSRPRILVADDDPVSLVLVKSILKNEFDVTTVPDGALALAELNKNTYEIFITDLQMPGLDGFEILRELRKSESKVLSLVLTKFSDTRAIREAWRLGAFDLIDKPIDRNFLLEVVRIAVAFRDEWQNPESRKSSRTFRKLSWLDPLILDQKNLCAALNEDLESVSEVLGSFVKTFPRQVRQLELNFDPKWDFVQFIPSIKNISDTASTVYGIELMELCQRIVGCIENGESFNRMDLKGLLEACDELQCAAEKWLAEIGTLIKKKMCSSNKVV
ncbi:MAG: response regulator [Bdellovibrionales bacterium]|nr:response regulator [Bdellovibrionales bacterium]